jgi:hypothetical protein
MPGTLFYCTSVDIGGRSQLPTLPIYTYAQIIPEC